MHRKELNERPYEQLGMKFSDDEAGNRDRFVFRNKDKCLFVPELNAWTIWDGSRWKKSGIAEICKLADETAKNIYLEAKDCENSEGNRRLCVWAYKSHFEQKQRSMINMASRWPEMTASITEFDNDPDLINCLNGVVHLPTGELIGHDPSQRHIKICQVEYKPYQKSKAFDQFLKEIFLEDSELLSWLQVALGYQLTGHVSEQVFFAAYGLGANGKSTLYEAIIDLMGDYAGTMEFETILAGDKSNVRTLEAVGNLQGKRMVIASEVDSSKRLSEALIKKLTGGDTLKGAKLHGASYDFAPQHKINLLANHMPYTKDASYGMARRIKIIPFQRKFTALERDITLPNTLKIEAAGIFAWLVRGARRWYDKVNVSNGKPALGLCEAIDEATNNYLSDNDTLGTFLTDCTEKKLCTETSSKELHECYANWCHLNGETYQLPQKLFSDRLEERGYLKKRKASGQFYQCLSIKPEASPDF
ncbi:phage/plasmid primase, P4 family [Paracoccaceae bacterium]|nr:phage/plasmid primase, P4 family [Paracoccaceae bacterium]